MPPIEHVDIVNEKDEIIQTVPRSEAETKRLRFRIVHILLENKKGEILVQWRAAHKAYAPRTFTASAAGTVQAGDAYDSTCIRELEEELGISNLEPVVIGAFQTKGSHPCNGMLYAARYDGPVSGWEEEAEALDFWSAEEAEYMLTRYPYLLAPNFQVSLKKYLTWRTSHDL